MDVEVILKTMNQNHFTTFTDIWRRELNTSDPDLIEETGDLVQTMYASYTFFCLRTIADFT